MRPASASAAGKPPRSLRMAPLLTLVAAVGMVALYWLYLRSADVSPDSVVGYGFAIAGTTLLVAVGVGYVLRKRVKRNWSGLLHGALRWHIAGGVLALLLILMHAAGNFHPRTGTYALVSLIALVVSGIVGKALDRVAPHLAARAALGALTGDGEDRLDSLVVALDATQRNELSRSRTMRLPSKTERVRTPWDLAYYDLDMAPEEIPGLLTTQMSAVSRERRAQSARSTPTPVSPKSIVSASAAVRRKMDAERFYLRLVRVWRVIHTLLSISTLALILWHLEFAATLLLNAR